MAITPASGNVVPSNGSGVLQQQITLTNSAHGVKPLLMRLKVDYLAGTQKVVDQATCPAFPSGL